MSVTIYHNTSCGTSRNVLAMIPSVVDLTFASVRPRDLKANVKSKTTLATYISWCPFGSDIRNRVCSAGVRMSEPGR